MRMPTLFIPHGGGAWPFSDGFVSPRESQALRRHLEELPSRLAPKALVIISAHWERPTTTVMTSPRPPMHDDFGFRVPADALEWSAPGAPHIAEKMMDLLTHAGIPATRDERRGFDHGTFIPFKLAWPRADVPALQLSLTSSYDAREHLAVGAALAPLRDDGVLLIGSGMTFHNFESVFRGTGAEDSIPFDRWLRETATSVPKRRNELLAHWDIAPGARLAHPREDHLLPLLVVAGAAAEDEGTVTFNDTFGGMHVSGFQFGRRPT